MHISVRAWEALKGCSGSGLILQLCIHEGDSSGNLGQGVLPALVGTKFQLASQARSGSSRV